MEFNEMVLRQRMHELTEQGIIPSLLKVEMCLMPDVMLITKPVERFLPNGVFVSTIYPNLVIEVWNKTGWELT